MASALALPIVLVVPAPWGLVVWAVAVVSVVVVDGLRGPRPRVIEVERHLPEVLALEAPSEVAWTVRNTSGSDTTVHVADDLVPSLRASARRFHVRVPAGGRVTHRVAFAPARRGTFQPETVTVRTEGPWGLGARQRDRVLPGRLAVHPAFRSRDAVAERLDRDRVAEVGRRSARARGGGTEFESLREYGPDDEFRRIDWAATARAGQPIVRTYRPERNQSLVLLLDAGRVSAGLVDGVPRLDHGMDAVLALATAALRLGDRCGLVAFGADVRRTVPGSTRPVQRQRLSQAMFELEPELAESDYVGAFSHTAARFRRRSLLVLLSDVSSGAVLDTLLPALPVLLRRHLVIVAGVTDPEARPDLGRSPDSGSAVYRTGAALQLEATTTEAVAALRARGALVVTGPPSELAGRLVDHYLEIKATGRL